MNKLGTLIQTKRKERGYSIRKLAEHAGISHTEIKRIEDGQRKQTSPQILRAIATALGAPYEELMAAAGYMDGILTGVDDLSAEETAKVNEYIAFLKSQRKPVSK